MRKHTWKRECVCMWVCEDRGRKDVLNYTDFIHSTDRRAINTKRNITSLRNWSYGSNHWTCRILIGIPLFRIYFYWRKLYVTGTIVTSILEWFFYLQYNGYVLSCVLCVWYYSKSTPRKNTSTLLILTTTCWLRVFLFE